MQRMLGQLAREFFASPSNRMKQVRTQPERQLPVDRGADAEEGPSESLGEEERSICGEPVASA